MILIDDAKVIGGIYNHRDFHFFIKRDKTGWYAVLEVPEQFKLPNQSNVYTQTSRNETLSSCYDSNISKIDELYGDVLDEKNNN